MEIVAEHLTDLTGLFISYNIDRYQLSNIENGLYTSIIVEDDHHFAIIKLGSIKIDYLLGATLQVLVNLGGEYKGYIPPWASQKWNDIKDKIDQLPNIGTPKYWQN